MPRRDAFGRPIEAQSGIGPDILSPLWAGTAKNDPTIKALLDAGVHIPAPRRENYSPQQYSALQEAVGRIAKPRLDVLVQTPAWRRQSDDDREKTVRDLMKDAREAAKVEVFGAPPKKERSGTSRSRNLPALPAGAVSAGRAPLPPPPPGATMVR